MSVYVYVHVLPCAEHDPIAMGSGCTGQDVHVCMHVCVCVTVSQIICKVLYTTLAFTVLLLSVLCKSEVYQAS